MPHLFSARHKKNALGTTADMTHLLWTTLPSVLWIGLFLVLPSLYLVGMAFMTNDVYGQPSLPLSSRSFEQLSGYGYLGWSPANLQTLWRSIGYTLLSSALTVLVAYPMAAYIALCRPQARALMILAVMMPSWTNQVVRAFGWMNVLAPDTTLAKLASLLGLTTPELGLYPSSFAVILGLVYNFLPFMVLPLYNAFEKLDGSLVEAACDLYASPFKAFWTAIFPQTLPGLLAGLVLVMIPAFGMYVVPELLGGGRAMMIGNLVATQFAEGANWPLGAAGALLMLLATLMGIYCLRRIGRRFGGGEEMVI